MNYNDMLNKNVPMYRMMFQKAIEFDESVPLIKRFPFPLVISTSVGVTIRIASGEDIHHKDCLLAIGSFNGMYTPTRLIGCIYVICDFLEKVTDLEWDLEHFRLNDDQSLIAYVLVKSYGNPAIQPPEETTSDSVIRLHVPSPSPN